MNETLDCEEARISLGVYVLGALDPAEQAAVDAHLAGCAECRAELVGLDGLPALLGMVSAEDAAELAERESGIPPALSADPDRSAPDPASLSAARNRRNRRGRLRIWRSKSSSIKATGNTRSSIGSTRRASAQAASSSILRRSPILRWPFSMRSPRASSRSSRCISPMCTSARLSGIIPTCRASLRA